MNLYHSLYIQIQFECILTWNCFAVHPFSDTAQLTFRVLVSEGNCPDSPEPLLMIEGIGGGFPCKQDEVLQLDGARNIRWMKVNASSAGSCSATGTSSTFCRLLGGRWGSAGRHVSQRCVSLRRTADPWGRVFGSMTTASWDFPKPCWRILGNTPAWLMSA